MTDREFRYIIRVMKKAFGTISMGFEEMHLVTLNKFEGAFLKLNATNPKMNSSAVKDSICLALYKMWEHIDGTKTDVHQFETTETIIITDKILMLSDPLVNEKLASEAAKEGYDLASQADREKYFKEEIQCLLRIYDSIDYWQNQYGSDGYFIFLKDVMTVK